MYYFNAFQIFLADGSAPLVLCIFCSGPSVLKKDCFNGFGHFCQSVVLSYYLSNKSGGDFKTNSKEKYLEKYVYAQ